MTERQGFKVFSKESGRHDLNVRPPAPKAGALAKLSYAPMWRVSAWGGV